MITEVRKKHLWAPVAWGDGKGLQVKEAPGGHGRMKPSVGGEESE